MVKGAGFSFCATRCMVCKDKKGELRGLYDTQDTKEISKLITVQVSKNAAVPIVTC